MGVESLHRGSSAYEAAHARRQDEAVQGDAQLTQVRTGSSQAAKQTASRVRDGFQRDQAAAAKFAQLERGQQAAETAAQAADTQHPENAEPALQPQQPEIHANENLPTQPPTAEQPTPTQEAVAPEPQASLAHNDNLPDPQTANQPAGHDAPAVPHAPQEARPSQQADNHAQPQHGGQGDPSGNPAGARTTQRQPSTTARRSDPTAQPTTPEAKAHLTPEQQQQLRYARLQGGGQVGTTPRTPVSTNPTALLAQGTTVPAPQHPETLAQQAPARSVIMCSAPHLTEEQQPAYAEGLRCMYELAHMEQPRPQGPQASPMSAAVFQAATPAMTREQMLARLTRDNNRGRGEGSGVEGLTGGSIGLTREYMIRSRAGTNFA